MEYRPRDSPQTSPPGRRPRAKSADLFPRCRPRAQSRPQSLATDPAPGPQTPVHRSRREEPRILRRAPLRLPSLRDEYAVRARRWLGGGACV
ncbi:hypothetical protein NDU88_007338 [Pleurodeles waltl]|uniref:Uncharacterized protein n=1 Tax=Pleurodeles waltl TaxID=8319 RepID=A0AAV7PL01_PLEWA|nr:hypothetical protein NDU88_007338 [Pleurodeles waltl]